MLTVDNCNVREYFVLLITDHNDDDSPLPAWEFLLGAGQLTPQSTMESNPSFSNIFSYPSSLSHLPASFSYSQGCNEHGNCHEDSHVNGYGVFRGDSHRFFRGYGMFFGI